MAAFAPYSASLFFDTGGPAWGFFPLTNTIAAAHHAFVTFCRSGASLGDLDIRLHCGPQVSVPLEHHAPDVLRLDTPRIASCKTRWTNGKNSTSNMILGYSGNFRVKSLKSSTLAVPGTSSHVATGNRDSKGINPKNIEIKATTWKLTPRERLRYRWIATKKTNKNTKK